MAAAASLQALQGELQGLANRVQAERVSDEDRTRFQQYLQLFHQTRQSHYLPSLPVYGDKKPDLLLLYKTVREQYGTVSEMDMEDWLSVARLLKLRVHAITNGLKLLKETFDHFLAPLDDPRTYLLTAALQATSQPQPSSLVQPLLFVPEIKFPIRAQQPLPAVLPHARLDLQRILLGLDVLEISAFQALDGLLLLVAEGRLGEPRREEISRCTVAVERALRIGKSKKFPILVNHALHSLGLLLSRGVQEATIGLCTEIFGAGWEFPIDTRVLAGKVLVLVEGLASSSSVLKNILRTTLEISDHQLFPIVVTLLARNIHALTVRDVIFGIFPKFPNHAADTRFIGLVLLLIGNFAEEISRSPDGVPALASLVVNPLVDEISDRKGISDPVWEAGVSVLLRVGVHPELRRALEISDSKIIRMCWNLGESEIAVRSLWNVLSESLVE